MNFNFGLSDIILVSPMIALFIASLIPITIKVLRGNQEQQSYVTLTQGLMGLLASAGLLLIFSTANKGAFGNMLVFDGITLWLGFIALAATAGAYLLMHENLATCGDQFSEMTFLTLNSALGMIILVSAQDLLMVFIGLEIMSLAAYLMIAMSHEQKLSKEAALKYFVLGSFASGLFLYGISFLFGTTGSTLIPEITNMTAQLMTSNRLFVFGIVFVVLGFCFKVSIAPFHAWTPDVYQGAPTPVTTYMSTAMKAVSFAAFLRIIFTKALPTNLHLFDVLQWFAVITMIVGNVAAILQTNLKRMLAYSSVAHSGYLLVGIITAGISHTASFGTSGVIFYLMAYSVMTVGAFAIVSVMEKNIDSSLTVDDLAGLSKTHPFMAFCLTLFLLSLAGLPPTVGFFGKFYMFSAAIGEGLIWLAVWGVINSVISVYYYLRPIVIMYMKEGDAVTATHSLVGTKAAIFICVILVITLGLFSGEVFKAIELTLM
jgi:NADH-quinone oxidoreductase subunit N